MSKQKTKSSAKKRFKVTGTGKIKRKHAFKNHILTKKSKKRKLKLTHSSLALDLVFCLLIITSFLLFLGSQT